MSSRAFITALLVLAVSSLVVVVSYGATWATATVAVLAGATSPQDPVTTVELSGSELVPLGGAMGWVGLASVAALLATRRWGRRLTGLIVTLAGGAAGVAALTFALTDAVSGGPGTFVTAALQARSAGEVLAGQASLWWILALLGALGMVTCGAWALIAGPSWPTLSSRYSRDAAHDAPLSAAATWDALDRGEDPTAFDDQPGSMGVAADPEEDR